MLPPQPRGQGKARPSGFTLSELLVVVLLLGVLLAVALPLYQQASRKSVPKPVKQNLRTIAIAAHAYRMRHGRFPATYTNPGKNAALPPGDFIGPGRDLEAMPFGPRNVWYEWFIGNGQSNNGHFIVKANEGGENLWGGTNSTNGSAMFDLKRNRYYVQNNTPFD